MERGFEALIKHVGHLVEDGKARVWVEFEDEYELYIETPEHFSIQFVGDQSEEDCDHVATAEIILDMYLGDEMEGKFFDMYGAPLAWRGPLLS